MKKLFFLTVLCFSVARLFAQNVQKIDTVYYLLDTTRTAHNDQMWKLEYDAPMMYAAILCPCVEGKDMPAFTYRTDQKVKQIWKSTELARHKLLTLPELIRYYKMATTYSMNFLFVFLEPLPDNKYILHPVKLTRTRTTN